LYLQGAGAYLGSRKLKNIPDKIRIYLLPPPGTKRLSWIVKRRYPVKMTGVAVALLVLAAGWLAWERFAVVPAPRIALLYIKPSQTAPMSRKVKGFLQSAKTEWSISPVLFAQKLLEELDLRGGSITTLQWVERNTLDDAIKAAGADFAKPATIEPVALKVARASALSYYLTGALEPKGFDAWRLKLKLIDVQDGSVEASITVEGNLAPELADAASDQLRRVAATLAPVIAPKVAPAPPLPVSPTAAKRETKAK
jgi:hypothetical protein